MMSHKWKIPSGAAVRGDGVNGGLIVNKTFVTGMSISWHYPVCYLE